MKMRSGVLRTVLPVLALLCAVACVERVHAANEDVILLVVDELIYSEMQSEVLRLKSDLENEGHAAKIKSWPTTGSASNLWVYLVSEYSAPGQDLAGALLIGRLPTEKNSSTDETTDHVFWNMAGPYRSVSQRHIWVSRITGVQYQERNTTQLRYVLDANHYYRTSQSRLPYASFYGDYAFNNDVYYYPNNGTNALVIWPTVERAVMESGPSGSIFKCWRTGGELYDLIQHGGAFSSTVGSLLGHPCQIRVNLCTSCSGAPSALSLIVRRGGGCILSVGGSATMWSNQVFVMLDNSTQDRNFRTRLSQGYSWGDSMLYSHPFGDFVRTMYYGDLSLRAKNAPSNARPEVASFTCDVTSGTAPLTVQFSTEASDSDGSLVLSEWWVETYRDENRSVIEPVYTNNSLSQIHTFMRAHRYQPEMQVMDNYRAREWTDPLTIIVGANPAQPLHVNCGKTLADGGYGNWGYSTCDYIDGAGNVWLHDQVKKADITWGWETPTNKVGTINGDILGTDDDDPYVYYRTAAAGNLFRYRIPLSNGSYKVTVCFADPASAIMPGERLMDVSLEGAPWLVGYDILAQAGAVMTAVSTSGVASVSDGELTIEVKPNAASEQDAVLNCFIVEPYSAANHAPATTGSSPVSPVAMDEGATLVFSVTASDTDGDPLWYTWTLDGTVQQASTIACCSYSPDHYAAGVHTLVALVDDWKGGRASNVWNVTVADVNGAPVAQDIEFCTPLNTTTSVVLTALDPDGDPLMYSVEDNPLHGILSGTAPSLTYTPAGGYTGPDGFTYKASDGTNESALATVTIRVGTAGLVKLVAKDQCGADVSGALIYVRELATWYPAGTNVLLTVGNRYRVQGKALNVTGAERYETITPARDEVVVPFWKSEARARDQYGADVAGAKVNMAGATGSPFLPGTAITLPRDAIPYIYGYVPSINGMTKVKYVKFRDGLDYFDPGFWKFTVRCRDEHGAVTPGGRAYLMGVGTNYYYEGTELTLPDPTELKTKSARGTLLADVYVTNIVGTGVSDVTVTLRSMVFKAVATNSVRLVPGADIEIYASGLPKFGNGTAQLMPYPDTIRVKVWNGTTQMLDKSGIWIDAATDEIVLLTSWVDPNPADNDEDGLPDDTDPDDDNDGMTDADEAIAGTDPWDAGERFQVSGFGVQGGVPCVFFDSVSGRIYGVYYRDDLLNGEWLPLETNLSGSGSPMQCSDPSAGWRRFYRLRVRLP